MIPPPLASSTRDKDVEQLKLLATFHYVLAAVGALFACLPLLHVGLGLMMVTHPDFMSKGHNDSPPPAWFGYIFVIMGGFFVLFGWTAAICTFVSGRYLSQRRRKTFSFVVAAVLCIFMPFGTILGIFTLIILSRDSVQQLYSEANAS